jgi:transposase-like protein
VVMQYLLEGFPDGAQRINAALSILNKEGKVIYFLGGDNYFSHPQVDKQGKRFALASLMENGHVRASELENELGIAHRTLMNWKAQCEKDGACSFYRKASAARAPVMTEQTTAQCAALLATGMRTCEVARQVGIRDSTLRKAMRRDGTLRRVEGSVEKKKEESSSKSERSVADAQAAEGMGTACTRADERVAAAMGLAECATARFEMSHDVQMGGCSVVCRRCVPMGCSAGLIGI